jgi:hypothetical protein
MIPCPRLPLFIYGDLLISHKTIALAGKLEGALAGRLWGFELTSSQSIQRSTNAQNFVDGEILWLHLQEYDTLIDKLDRISEQQSSKQIPNHRSLCEPITNAVIYSNIPPTTIKCWSYIATPRITQF